ncbi:class I SAM-dependent methyltransferase [Candidatus Peregrinibacteria bacterium]|nr:MAG: class I SAM-dependent methyltransferase [Candidatus Peregrinibacteria bacterium]
MKLLDGGRLEDEKLLVEYGSQYAYDEQGRRQKINELVSQIEAAQYVAEKRRLLANSLDLVHAGHSYSPLGRNRMGGVHESGSLGFVSKRFEELEDLISVLAIRAVQPEQNKNLMVEFGPGSGRNAERVLKDISYLSYLGLEMSEVAAKRARETLGCEYATARMWVKISNYLKFLDTHVKTPNHLTEEEVAELMKLGVTIIQAISSTHYFPVEKLGMILAKIAAALRPNKGTFIGGFKTADSDDVVIRHERLFTHRGIVHCLDKERLILRVFPETRAKLIELLEESGFDPRTADGGSIQVVDYDKPGETARFEVVSIKPKMGPNGDGGGEINSALSTSA